MERCAASRNGSVRVCVLPALLDNYVDVDTQELRNILAGFQQVIGTPETNLTQNMNADLFE